MQSNPETQKSSATEVYIDTKRKRFVIIDFATRQMWAKEYFQTEQEAKDFCRANGFIVVPAPTGSEEVSELITIIGIMLKCKAFIAAAHYTEQLRKAFADYSSRSVTWSIEDFEGAARERELMDSADSVVDRYLNNLDIPLPIRYHRYDRSKFSTALEEMIKHHDAECGISWDTIRTSLDLNCKLSKRP